ncbi:MAG TPA: NAD(P)H-hydrate dehydratase [Nitrososphaeraceae archaeon]|nr:NAD(P)H-hydrate dehydratase [Nitrososphaeraceae archaeon]
MIISFLIKILEPPELILINDDMIKRISVSRKISSRKGDNGIVLVVGGNRIYHGAPILASIAALRSGTDLVYTAIPSVNVEATRSFSPNLIVLPLVDEKLTMGSASRLIKTLPKKVDSATIGMGMSIAKKEALMSLIEKLLKNGTKLVLDASALIPEILPKIKDTGCIITPHGGEYMRIFETELKTQYNNENEQIVDVLKNANKYGITIILKGWKNIISNGELIAVIERSTPAMTVGGTGDVLAGLVAGFFSKMNSFEAACTAVYFNGLAGIMAYQKLGLHMVASDLLDNLPQVMKKFDQIENN